MTEEAGDALAPGVTVRFREGAFQGLTGVVEGTHRWGSVRWVRVRALVFGKEMMLDADPSSLGREEPERSD